jgi:hypothetical protein
LKLRDIEFGKVLCASGARGFFGEGYRFHPYLRPFGLNYDGSTLVSKTTTFLDNRGNMALNPDFTPRDFFPDCIRVYPFRGMALNAVNLSGPGLGPLLDTGMWQSLENPFLVSFMAIGKTLADRIGELKAFVRVLNSHIRDFRAKFGLQINYTCPNTGHQASIDEMLEEYHLGMPIAAQLGVPLMPKLNFLIPPRVACGMAEHPECDALCISNAIKFGQLKNFILWKKWFGTDRPEESPLAKYGGGALSGKPLLAPLLEYLGYVRRYGLKKPVNAGGGILSLSDAVQVFEALGNTGNDSIALGSISFLRPWRVQGIIRALNES